MFQCSPESGPVFVTLCSPFGTAPSSLSPFRHSLEINYQEWLFFNINPELLGLQSSLGTPGLCLGVGAD